MNTRLCELKAFMSVDRWCV